MITPDTPYKMVEIIHDTWPQLFYLKKPKHMLYLFSKESCGPCGLVEKYLKNINDPRIDKIVKVDLEDFSDVPIPPENLELAKRYGVTATPVLIVVNDLEEKVEEFVGGMRITQNIRKVFDRYNV